MNIKTKISLGLFFLFAVILVVGGISIYYLKEISDDAKNIIRANYESIEYMQDMTAALDSLQSDSTLMQNLLTSLKLQENNVTEKGEMEETIRLRNLVNELKSVYNDSLIREARKSIHRITDLNLKAIIHKNALADETSRQATIYVIVIVTICFLVSFSFILNFPGYIANPIAQLTASIKAIANRNYEERLQFNRSDEFEELAQAFNVMAEKMDEYEHSNLANLLFEKKRIETIINRMNDPVIGLDDKRHIIFANREAIELINKKEGELVGHYAPDIAVTNDLLRRLIQGIANIEYTSNGKSSPSGAVIENADKPIKIFAHGKESYFTREIIPISITHTGEKISVPIGTVILLRNITPFKELDLAKTNFIATISHELKTPIASLQMGAKLLLDSRVGSLNEEQNRIVHTLNDETQRLVKITGELLDMAQVETGNIKLNLASVQATDMIEQACEAVKFQAEQRNVKLHLDIPDKPIFAQADKDKTTWVLINFLTNAIRHTPENGDVFIRSSIENERVRFSVKDSGMGIEPRHLEKIFDRFYRIPGSDPKKGTGLGLSICKEFIEAQRGNVLVQSELGKGSEFTFYLLEANR
ncbi:MAG TPA: PAS domain-containing sensor histidine kinase [Cytophagales bacterium]|jgi:two-component system, NtrC family, sensor histidine kinase KinB|nr:PAS domain-containing sensor histidine kinase [Cytophagales bacterium]